MNDSAPLTWIITEINKIVSTGANATASAIVGIVTPLAAVCFGIYIILICVNYMRGAESEPVVDFGLRIAGFAVIIGLGLNAGTYTSTVIPIVTGLGSDIANVVSGGTATTGSLDQLALHYFSILEKGYAQANRWKFPFNVGPLSLYFIKAACILLCLIPFLVAAAVLIVIADVGSVLVAMVGPLFFAALLFPATRQYFSAWVNTAFSYALMPIFVAVISTISVSLSLKMFSEGSSLEKTSLIAVFGASLGNLVLLLLLRQVSSLASSLSAGGINAGGGGGIGSVANSAQSAYQGSKREGSLAYTRSAGKGAGYVGGLVAGRVMRTLRGGNSIRKAG